MTKKEIRNAINKAVYQYAESLGYIMSDDGDGSTVTFWPEGAASADLAIDYHRSQHYAIALNWAPDKVKQDCDRINAYAEEQVRIYNV
jgi:hypothetical protein